MNDAYPTEAELSYIKNFDLRCVPLENLIEYIHGLWIWKDYLSIEEYDEDNLKLEIHTGGWSGHEEIIGVLMNTLFWHMYWIKSERGGHYYFEIPKGRYYGTDMAVSC